MGLDEKIWLNLVNFDNRFRELELKQWWLAEQIGVDRKTVNRWLTGQTKKIRRDNLQKLAQLLECAEEFLILQEEASQMASATEQKEAAKLIEQENLLEILTPTGKWPLLEGLIKASLEPNLPKSLLGQLYNFLCIAAWRQSDLSKAEGYLKKGLEIAEETGHKSVLARAKLNQATLFDFRGKIDQAIEGYLFCIENKNYLEDEGVFAAALSNIGCSYQSVGDLEKSIHYQEKAIEVYTNLGKDFNISIAYAGLCDALLEMGNLEKAWEACQSSQDFAERSQLKRGLADAKVFFSLISSAKKEYNKAYDYYLEATELFRPLEINEGRTYRAGALAMIGLGKADKAKEFLKLGIEASTDFPIEVEKLQAILKSLK